jgi:multicomponent Na+:H+ antiporter subunit F
MTTFLLIAALLVLVMVAVALARLLRSPRPVDWIMAAQLLGTAGIGALLLVGTATGASGALDLALLLALLAAFATLAFAASVRSRTERGRGSAAEAGTPAAAADTANGGLDP